VEDLDNREDEHIPEVGWHVSKFRVEAVDTTEEDKDEDKEDAEDEDTEECEYDEEAVTGTDIEIEHFDAVKSEGWYNRVLVLLLR